MTNPIKWPGGKIPLARRIVALFPEHNRLVEPFAGGAAVPLEHARRHPGKVRTIADLYAPVVAFWQVIQDPVSVVELIVE
jgi:DNA adenine methylase